VASPSQLGPLPPYPRSVLTTLLMRAPWLTTVILFGYVVLGPFASARLAGHRRTTATLLGVAMLGTAALTLAPAGDPNTAIGCNVGLPYINSFAVESTANILLFVPVSFLATVLWRRPVLAVLSASVFSALIEAVQAFVVEIGRACDTSDWITNTAGAIIGGTVAAAGLTWCRRRFGNARHPDAGRPERNRPNQSGV
jgi:hypothetical protein